MEHRINDLQSSLIIGQRLSLYAPLQPLLCPSKLGDVQEALNPILVTIQNHRKRGLENRDASSIGSAENVLQRVHGLPMVSDLAPNLLNRANELVARAANDLVFRGPDHFDGSRTDINNSVLFRIDSQDADTQRTE